MQTLTVDRHDFTFTVSRGINLAWAETGLCHGPEKYSDCRLLIMSVLDLQDTGLRLDMGREDVREAVLVLLPQPAGATGGEVFIINWHAIIIGFIPGVSISLLGTG